MGDLDGGRRRGDKAPSGGGVVGSRLGDRDLEGQLETRIEEQDLQRPALHLVAGEEVRVGLARACGNPGTPNFGARHDDMPVERQRSSSTRGFTVISNPLPLRRQETITFDRVRGVNIEPLTCPLYPRPERVILIGAAVRRSEHAGPVRARSASGDEGGVIDSAMCAQIAKNRNWRVGSCCVRSTTDLKDVFP